MNNQESKYFCADCGKSIDKIGRSTHCRICSVKNQWKNPKRYLIAKQGAKKRWQDPIKHILASKTTKKHWKEHPERHIAISKQIRKLWEEGSVHRITISQKAKQRYQDPVWHKITSNALKRKWKDPEFIKKHSGKNNHFYIHGKSEIPYGIGWTESLKQEIRDRDYHLCRNCKVGENGRAHDVHHIDFDKKNNNPMNLITLCKKCHDATKSKYGREKWINYFQDLQEETLTR